MNKFKAEIITVSVLSFLVFFINALAEFAKIESEESYTQIWTVYPARTYQMNELSEWVDKYGDKRYSTTGRTYEIHVPAERVLGKIRREGD